MNALLKLTRFPYEEPYQIQLLVEASNGRQRASIDYYTHASDLPELGEALLTFPLTESKKGKKGSVRAFDHNDIDTLMRC